MLRTMPQNSSDHKPSSTSPIPAQPPPHPSTASPTTPPASATPLPHHAASPSSAARQPPVSFASSVTPPLFHAPSQHSPSFHTNLESPISKNPHQRPSHSYPHLDHASTAPPAAQPKWRVTPLQKEALLAAFDEDPYPELAKKNQLAEQLGVTTTQISKWFQHRRESLTRLGQFKAQYNRTRRTPEELDVLQNAFDIDRYPTAEKLAELEQQLTGVTAKQIKLWFKHRRKQVQKRNRTTSNSPHQSPAISSAPVQSDPLHSVSVPLVARPVPNLPEVAANPSQAILPTAQHPAPIPAPAMVQQGASVSVPYNFNPHTYYSYKGPQMVFSQPSQAAFTELEYMALRGAQAIANGLPSPEALSRLSQLLSRPTQTIAEWFRMQEANKVNENMSDVHNSVFPSSPYGQQQDQGRTVQSSSYPSQGGAPQSYNTGQGAIQQADSSAFVGPNLSNMPSSVNFDSQKGIAAGEIESKSQDQNGAASSSKVEKSEGLQADVMHQVPSGMYHPYVYPAGMVSHPNVPFPTGQISSAPSAPMLAPLRYVPTTTTTTASAYPPGWYSNAPGFSKG